MILSEEEWEVIVKDMTDMGRKVSNLQKETTTHQEEISSSIALSKKIRRQITEEINRIKSLKDNKQSIKANMSNTAKSINDTIVKFDLLELQYSFTKDTADIFSNLGKLKVELQSYKDKSYSLIDDLKDCSLEENRLQISVNSLNDELERIEITNQGKRNKIQKLKTEMRELSRNMTARHMKKITNVEIIKDPYMEKWFVRITYRTILTKTKEVYQNRIMLLRTKDNDGVRWIKVRDDKDDKEIQSKKKLIELESIFNKNNG